MADQGWARLAARQENMLARRQLRPLGVDADAVRNQIAAGRWAVRSERVVSTFTGPLQFCQRAWMGVLHAGGDALVGGLSAAAVHRLRNWERPEITVLVDDRLDFEPVPGVQFVRTRRPLRELRDPRHELPLCRLEPAALLFAGYERSARTAQGLLAAVVQQRLATTADLREWVQKLRPLRRATLFREVLADIEGGSQSLGELDVARFCRRGGIPLPVRQTRRRDGAGRARYTDCEWELPGAGVVVLEVDGGFHMEAEHWEADIARQRALSRPGRIVVRCTVRELREEPHVVFRDLLALGVGLPQRPAPGRPTPGPPTPGPPAPGTESTG